LLFSLWANVRGQQPGNGITEPAQGDVISAVVIVRGTATDPNWLRYELAFRPEFAANDNWIVFAEGDQPVPDGTLAIWDTTVGRNTGAPIFPDGSYRLRLRVVRTDYNYDEYFVNNIIISNNEATPTPTITPTVTLEGGVAAPTTDPNTTPAAFQQPTVLPTLTPFPTPSPQPTPDNAPLGPNTPGQAGDEGGLLDQLSTVEYGRFATAFWLGMKWVGYLFALAAGYLLVRWLGRRLWRIILTKRTST
jgi:hypothetical protein